MAEEIRVTAIDPADGRLDELAAEARAEGYTFVDRLLSEARTSVNRFDRPGEVFCGVFLADELVGCGGINKDPYSDQDVGRLRHVFIARGARRKGVATILVQNLLTRSRPRFNTIRLRTSDKRADRFYEAMGFSPTLEEAATHIIRI